RSVFQNCLELYPMAEWNKVMKQIGKLNRFVKKNNDFIRLFTAGVKKIELDASGRILLSKDLLAFSGIQKEVVMTSQVSIVEIWDKNNYEKAVNGAVSDFADLAEQVMGGINIEELDGLS
ncbi:division/cell wall cluster transcriptional repressor MraZ, partial [Flavobacteriaceae bacterium]|nr:division/cell wall cluster transcriptional repressor MraZ [Flavobacteriaceae bacterium]